MEAVHLDFFHSALLVVLEPSALSPAAGRFPVFLFPMAMMGVEKTDAWMVQRSRSVGVARKKNERGVWRLKMSGRFYRAGGLGIYGRDRKSQSLP